MWLNEQLESIKAALIGWKKKQYTQGVPRTKVEDHYFRLLVITLRRKLHRYQNTAQCMQFYLLFLCSYTLALIQYLGNIK